MELAEEKSLELDSDACQKARSDLTNLRTRLSADIAWLPGVSPGKASALLDKLVQDPMSLQKESGLPPLAHLNLLAAALESRDCEDESADLARFIEKIAYLSDAMRPEDVVRDINEDRSISGFQEVRALDQVEAELAEQKRYYRNVIRDALDKVRSLKLVEIMADVVDKVTSGGTIHAPGLIDDLVDSYEVETQDFLQREANNVRKLIKAIRESVGLGEAAIEPYIDKLDAVARNWGKIAKPIQLSAKARGTEYPQSNELAWDIRGLSLALFNEHDMLGQAKRLTQLIQEVFAQSPDVSERVEEDADALTNIARQRDESAAISPIHNLLESVLKNIERSPADADQEAHRLLSEGEQLLRESSVLANSAAYREANDLLALGVMQCAVAYGSETSKWAPCVQLLESALGIASDVELKEKIKENLVIVRNNHTSLGDLEPIKKAPSLRTINGIGFTLYGCTDKNSANGSYMATYYFVFFFIPLIPIARYRVIATGAGYRFLGKGPLRVFDKWHIAVSLGLFALLFIGGS
ncbi:hypothetical protein SAMN05445504_3613 [Burkholderia sp. CF099]|nr:hypothetical protein SAMN05445504_3613 [Burkholderia sp. CF099]